MPHQFTRDAEKINAAPPPPPLPGFPDYVPPSDSGLPSSSDVNELAITSTGTFVRRTQRFQLYMGVSVCSASLL